VSTDAESGEPSNAERIVSTPDVLDGEPRIAGRRIGVRFVTERVEDAGFDPATVADRHDLDIADVYRALAYYHDNPREMAALERAERDLVAAHRES
jgi:uncharacterized protein (DUF433 family)